MNSCKDVIENDFCIGCGVCTIKNPESVPIFNENGFLVPKAAPIKVMEIDASKICPFSNKGKDETELADYFFSDAKYKHDTLGRYQRLNIASIKDEQERMESSSGGILTTVNKHLLREGIVDAVIAVGQNKGEKLFSYQVCSDPEQLHKFAKSKYYPIEIGSILSEIMDDDKKYAIVALPCVTKALRNLQLNEPALQRKFPFISTLICGHLKSKYYADFIGWQAGIKPGDLKSIDFRVKNPSATANCYSIRVTSSSEDKLLEHSSIKYNDWGVGFFKPKSCDFCDDVFGELGDISVGDAWLPKYTKDYRGNSLLVIRSKLAEKLFDNNASEYIFHEIDTKEAVDTQRGGVNHKRRGIIERIDVQAREAKPVPKKRSFLHLRGAMTENERLKARLRTALREKGELAYKDALKQSRLNVFYETVNSLVENYYLITIPTWKRIVKRLLGR
jgi:coenzyme F420 hydrogenase subunit beta